MDTYSIISCNHTQTNSLRYELLPLQCTNKKDGYIIKYLCFHLYSLLKVICTLKNETAVLKVFMYFIVYTSF